MRYIGLDIGTKRIGIAVSDELAFTAQGIESYNVSDDQEKDEDYIISIAEGYKPYTFIVGLPKNMNGTEGPMAEKAREYGKKLKEKSGAPVIFWDERLSTVSAERTLIDADMSRKKRRQVVDKLAAVIILQSYLGSL